MKVAYSDVDVFDDFMALCDGAEKYTTFFPVGIRLDADKNAYWVSEEPENKNVVIVSEKGWSILKIFDRVGKFQFVIYRNTEKKYVLETSREMV